MTKNAQLWNASNCKILAVSPDTAFLERVRSAAVLEGSRVEIFISFAAVPRPFPLQHFDVAICEYDPSTRLAIEFLEALDKALGDSFKIFPIILVSDTLTLKALRAEKWPLSVRRFLQKDLNPRFTVAVASLEAVASKALDTWSH